MTGLEALNIIVDKCAIKEYNKNGYLISWIGTTDKECIVIEKELKALELIKEHNIVVAFLRTCPSVEFYNNAKIDKLSKEEFDLLKEVL